MDFQSHPIDTGLLKIGKSSGERAAGVHASDLYGSLYRELNPDRYGRPGEPPPLLLETGLIFETMLEEGFIRRLAANGGEGEQIERPGEFTHRDTWDGYDVTVHYNPDLFIFNGQFRVGEIKATWMSYIPDLTHEKYAKWLTQIKFYCKMQRTRFARLYAFFICGTYKPPTVPLLKAWDLEFSQDELDMEYAMLMWHGVSSGVFPRADSSSKEDK